MRVALVLGAVVAGGAERVAVGLANHLDAAGDAVAIVCTTDTGDAAYPLSAGIRWYRGMPAEDSVRAKTAYLEHSLREFDPDVIVSFVLRLNLLLPLLPRLRRYPIVLSERNDPAHLSDKRLLAARRAAYPRAAGFVFQTPAAESFYTWYAGPTCVLPNPVAVPQQVRPLHDRRKRVIMVSRLNTQKNPQMAIEAFAQSGCADAGYQLAVYGTGPLLPSLEAYAHQACAPGSVVFEGVTKDVYRELDDARVFLLSSDYEGVPNALLEAMAAGLAVISTDCSGGGPRSLIRPGQNGCLVERGDARAMAKALSVLVADEAVMQRMGDAARRSVADMTPEAIYGRWRAFLQSVLDE